MHSSADQAETPSGDGENQDFSRVESILKEIKGSMKYLTSVFHKSELTDDALHCINTEKEMFRVLKDDVQIPVGVALQFSKKWFDEKIDAANNENVPTAKSKTKEAVAEGRRGTSQTEKEPKTKFRNQKESASITLALEKKISFHGEERPCVKKGISSSQDKEAEDSEFTKPLSTDENANVHDIPTIERNPMQIKEQSNFADKNLERSVNSSRSTPEDAVQALHANQPNIDVTDPPAGETSVKQNGKSFPQGKQSANAIMSTDVSKENRKPACSRKPFGKEVGDLQYTTGSIFMEEENREIEFKALTNETPEKLPWKIMEKARIFICGILNAGGEGTIYFGIGDSYDPTNNFTRGEIIGLEVEKLKDEINKAFQSTLDDHIKSDDGMMKKGGDMNCVKIYFVAVEESGERTGRYVIEIEIKRDWKFCKDNVYYFRPWTEKRGTTQKGGLNDLYKITKEKWEDPVIRTCGKSATVKNVETDKQIKEPLSQKYNEWLKDDANRKQFKRLSSYDGRETLDIQKFSSDVQESLRELKYKENDYILIANKVPPQHRDSTNLAFLQSIPWLAVFDLFDPNSKKDGLHFILNETSDSARATVKELSDFKSLKSAGDEEMSTRGTTWIFRNQLMHESDWTRNSKDCLYRALSAYHEQSPTGRIHSVFLGLSDEFLQEMADIIDSFFSIIGNNASKSITILSEKKDIGSGIVKFLKADVQKDVKPPCSIFGFPFELLRDSVKQMLGPINFDEPGATTDLPYLNGKPRPVLNKRLNSLTDLEIYFPKPKLNNSFPAMIKAKENFYKGDVIKQLNLFHHDDIARTRAAELTFRINKCLKRLSDPSDLTRHVETVRLSYESGSGATTLCRRILWDTKSTYRCAVVKTISANTDYQIEELQTFLYETSPSFIPPVLVLVDNFPEQQVRHLEDNMSQRKTKCVLLNTIPIAKMTEGTYDDVAELGQLDRTEIEKVKRILLEVDSKDGERREAAAKVLEREKRFIWLGLELFGRQYIDIEPRLSKHINDIISQNLTEKLKDAYEMILHFCCLLDFYSKGRCIYPHPCAVDILYDRGELSKDDVNKIDKIHEKFGGLLLEDHSESKGYRGWRPAHFLVGEVVRKEMDLLTTAKTLVKEMNTGLSYAKKYLISDTVNVFLKREKKSDSTSDNSNEPDFVLYSSFEDADVFGSLEIRTRYSALIMDTSKNLETQPDVTSALDLLITLTENVTTTQHKARTWQQIARVFAYQIGMKTIPKDDLNVSRINQLLYPGHDHHECPTNGFEIAHLAIDQAIKLQESYVHHLVTKGALFMAELRDHREEQKHRSVLNQNLKEFIQQVVNTSKKAIDVYDAALKKTVPDGYLHAMVGKITTVIVLLEILKQLPFFAHHNDGPDESFKNFISSGTDPEDLKATLSEDDLEYFISLRKMVVQLLNDFFQEIKLRRTWSFNAYNDQELTNAKIRALKLRENFYQISGLDRLQFPLNTGCEEDIANQILFQYGETPYGRWENLPSHVVAQIYKSLKEAIPKKITSHDAMLMCARAALQEKVTIDELLDLVEQWCQKFPRSIWANLFNYMIHFPVPNGSLSANVPIVKSSVAACKSSIPRSKQNYRKSAAEYLLGKGVGLHSILGPNEVSRDSMDMKTKFWRSKEVFQKLERLRGQKILGRKGVLAYKGIEILFDNDRYPKESRDDLWFCLGFTVSGPYAYDPMEEDMYKDLKKVFVQPSTNERDHCPLMTPSEETQVKKTLYSCDSKSITTLQSTLSKGQKGNQKNLPDVSLRTPKTRPVSKRPRNKTEGPWKGNPKLIIRKRSVDEGHQTTFAPKWIDDKGRVHHGACVRRTKKSSECGKHTTDPVPDSCYFAHSWKGDTLQFVCQLCTKNELWYCDNRDEHSRHICNLGAYFNEQAEQWSS